MSDQDQPTRGTRRSFTAEFKRDAVALVLDEKRTIADVARSLDVGESNLGNWVRQAQTDAGERPGLRTDEREELTVLRREVRQLKMERELLKRAAAFFAKELGQ